MQASVQQETAGVSADVSGLETTASVLARSLLREAGRGWYDGAACDGDELNRESLDPDAVERVGLGEERCATDTSSVYHRISYDKLDNLRLAELEADPDNGALDYEEARASLGLEGTQ